jgi:CBS domain-containing protein
MVTVKDIMTSGSECIGERESLVDAAQKMRDLDVGALPICGEDGKLKGMITDRDIVVKCLAQGDDPASTTAEMLAQGTPIVVDADDDVNEAIDTMEQCQIRRLPVLSGHMLVGILTQADIARNMAPEKVGELVEELSE